MEKAGGKFLNYEKKNKVETLTINKMIIFQTNQIQPNIPSINQNFGTVCHTKVCLFEVGSQTFKNDYKISRSQPQDSTLIVL